MPTVRCANGLSLRDQGTDKGAVQIPVGVESLSDVVYKYSYSLQAGDPACTETVAETAGHGHLSEPADAAACAAITDLDTGTACSSVPTASAADPPATKACTYHPLTSAVAVTDVAKTATIDLLPNRALTGVDPTKDTECREISGKGSTATSTYEYSITKAGDKLRCPHFAAESFSPAGESHSETGKLAEWMANGIYPWTSLRALLANRLVALDK